MLQPKKKKARNSINGDPQWEMMDAPAVIGEELTMKLCGLANVVGEDDLTALGAAKNAGFAAHIDSCAEASITALECRGGRSQRGDVPHKIASSP